MFVALERLLNLQTGYRRRFQIDGKHLLLLVVEVQAVLLDSRCPHQGVSLETASLVGRVLRCSRHGVEFDVLSGQALNLNCPGLRHLPLVYHGDRIGIDV
ncbi:MAG: nitrite reductase/ring-hydroxylating ferredoxin subunit [Pseudomonas sp.]|jgi:nitrite reductase/ring-hydroxylating ferredoxin subunit